MVNVNSDIADRITITMRRGDTYNLPIKFFDSVNVPLNLTGCKVLWQFRRNSKNGQLLQEVTEILGGSWTAINIFTPKFICILPLCNIIYTDFQLTFPDGTITTYFEGNVIVNEDISF